MRDNNDFFNQPLPENWVWATLAEIASLITKGSTPTTYGFEYGKSGINFVRAENISDKTGLIEDISVYIGDDAHEYLTRSVLNIDDILFSIAGTIGRAGLVRELDLPANTNQALAVVRIFTEYVSAKYVLYFLKSPYIQEYVEKIKAGVGRSNLNLIQVGELVIPLAPLEEQHRIIDAIEAQFSRLDSWLEVMEKLREQLPRLRASILKAAVEGRLIAQDPDDEPADILLQRILDERRRKWEADYLAELTAQDKPAPRDDKWKEKYPEPLPPDRDDLLDLPEGWIWVSLPQLGELSRGKSKHRPRNDPSLYDGAYPFVQTGDVRAANGVIATYSQTYNEKGLAQSRLWPSGTLCITIAANIADTGILGFDACFPDSIVGFIPEFDSCNVVFVEYYFRTIRQDLNERAPATAQKNINVDILSKLAVAYPPREEQNRIVDDVSNRLAIIDRLESTLEINLKRAEKMRQSILKQAFEGRLVEQDTTDEPAMKLLERIQTERDRRAEEESQKPKQQRERTVSKTQAGTKPLYDILKEAGKPLSPRQLFFDAGFAHETIDDFYKELRHLIDSEGVVRTWHEGNVVYLEVIS